jgi:hypothetical protein
LIHGPIPARADRRLPSLDGDHYSDRARSSRSEVDVDACREETRDTRTRSVAQTFVE